MGTYAPPSAAERAACIAPVLCIQPMTAGDARYDAGRRAGLLEAAAMLEKSADRLEAGNTDALDRLMATTFRSCAESFRFEAGAP